MNLLRDNATHRPGISPVVAGVLILLAIAWPARASCIPPSEPAQKRLDSLLVRTPGEVVAEVDRLLAGPGLAPQSRARLLAIKSEALGRMSRADQAVAVARQGLAEELPATSAVRSELLWLLTSNTFDQAQLGQLRPVVAETLGQLDPDSLQAVCLNISLGNIHRMLGEYREAAHYLTSAYRKSDRDTMRPANIEAARLLARLMGDAENVESALVLNGKVLEYEQATGATFMLGFAHGFRGIYLADAGRYDEALAELDIAIAAHKAKGDQFGEAYLNQHICRARIGLGQWALARPYCESSSAFLGSQGDGGHWRSEELLASIDLAEGNNAEALRRLDDVIAKGAGLYGVDQVEPFRLRSEAHRKLGDPATALADLQSYVDRYRDRMQTMRDRQTAILQAQFDTDLRIAENLFLQAELALERTKSRVWLERGVVLAALVLLAMVLQLIWHVTNARHKRQLLDSARTDPLTALPNRRYVTDQAQDALDYVRSTGGTLVVALIDIDHFKSINDTFGHAAGDQVLSAFGAAMSKTLRKVDIKGRWGGEEFLCVFCNTDLGGALATLERLRGAVTSMTGEADTEYSIGFSAGLAVLEPGLSLDALIERADRALYRAKAAGRNRTEIFTSEQVSDDTAADELVVRLRTFLSKPRGPSGNEKASGPRR